MKFNGLELDSKRTHIETVVLAVPRLSLTGGSISADQIEEVMAAARNFEI